MLPLVQVSAWAHAVVLKGTMAVHIQNSPNFVAVEAAIVVVEEPVVGVLAANTAAVAVAVAVVRAHAPEGLVLAGLPVGLE